MADVNDYMTADYAKLHPEKTSKKATKKLANQ